MAILIDLNQTLIAGVMVQIRSDKKAKVDEDLVRHLALNILRTHVKKFKSEYGEVILCCDNRTYWRKAYFPFYKASRKKKRKSSGLDWEMIYRAMDSIKSDLKKYFPYKMIDVENAEADDIIGTLVPRLSANSMDKIVIVSSDGDFLQLQKYPNVEQYNPITKKFIKSKNPETDLKEKILTGDTGDGIPNILSPADCFVREIRQKPMTDKKLSEFMNIEITDKSVKSEYYTGYIRNKTLIDLSFIPEEIKENINKTYNETKTPPRPLLFGYFVEKRLKNLLEVIEDF